MHARHLRRSCTINVVLLILETSACSLENGYILIMLLASPPIKLFSKDIVIASQSYTVSVSLSFLLLCFIFIKPLQKEHQALHIYHFQPHPLVCLAVTCHIIIVRYGSHCILLTFVSLVFWGLYNSPNDWSPPQYIMAPIPQPYNSLLRISQLSGRNRPNL